MLNGIIREEKKNDRGNKENIAQPEIENITDDTTGNKFILSNFELDINVVGANLYK